MLTPTNLYIRLDLLNCLNTDRCAVKKLASTSVRRERRARVRARTVICHRRVNDLVQVHRYAAGILLRLMNLCQKRKVKPTDGIAV